MHERTRLGQVLLIGLFVVCMAQVLYWILEQVHHAGEVHDLRLRVYEADAQAARILLESGGDTAELLALFPHLEVALTAAGGVRVSRAAREELDAQRRTRVNRFGWEGTFFLFALLLGVVVLSRALRREAELNRRQQNFLASVTHEFKSPLASLRLSVETLELRDPSPERRAQLVQRMLGDLEWVEGMVFKILTTAQLEEGQRRYEPEDLELAPLVERQVAATRRLAEPQDVSLSSELTEGLHIHADVLNVSSILQNLVDNAVKATAAAKGGEVLVRSFEQSGRAVVEVRDTGVGFAPAEAARLFDKFYRTGDELRRIDRGTGLGLYLVRRLAGLSGGRVSGSSEGPGRGACFRVSWPLRQEVTA